MKTPFPSTSCISECVLCGASEAHPIESIDRHGQPLQVVICGGCGVVHNHPIPSAEELSRFYSEEYRASYKGTREPKLRHAARYFPAAARHIQHHWKHYQHVKQVLDIGSGSGEFLYLMRTLDKQTMGLEPTRDYAHFCRTRLGLDITTGEIDSFVPDLAYDHIRLCHVVEHLRDPVSNLRRISQWLCDTGTLYVEVPDFERYCRIKTPGRIFHYGHIYNFDHDTFEYLIAKAGLEIVERAGPTAAFLRRAHQPVPATTTPGWPVQDKINFYRHHREGRLRTSTRMARCLAKVVKISKEHLAIARKPDHLTLANRAAAALRKMVLP
jgi:hypothetical protein